MTSINIRQNYYPMCNLTAEMFITQNYANSASNCVYDFDSDTEINYDDMPPLQQVP